MAPGALTQRRDSSSESRLDSGTVLAKFVDRLPIPPRAIESRVRRVSGHGASDVPLVFTGSGCAGDADAVSSKSSSSPRAFGVSITVRRGLRFVVRRGQPILVEWVYALPIAHLFTIDHSLHGAGTDVPDVRTIIHVHGLRAASADDGYPESWYSLGSLTSFYPNGQDAATLWYHTITPCPSRGSTSTPAWWGSI